MLENRAIAVKKPWSSAKSLATISVSLRSFANSNIERRASGVVFRGKLRMEMVEDPRVISFALDILRSMPLIEFVYVVLYW